MALELRSTKAKSANEGWSALLHCSHGFALPVEHLPDVTSGARQTWTLRVSSVFALITLTSCTVAGAVEPAGKHVIVVPPGSVACDDSNK